MSEREDDADGVATPDGGSVTDSAPEKVAAGGEPAAPEASHGPDASSEARAHAETEPETEAASDAETAPEAEVESAPEVGSEPELEPETETESQTDTESQPRAVDEPEARPKAEVPVEAEPAAESVAEVADSEPEVVEPEPESEIVEPEPETAAPADEVPSERASSVEPAAVEPEPAAVEAAPEPQPEDEPAPEPESTEAAAPAPAAVEAVPEVPAEPGSESADSPEPAADGPEPEARTSETPEPARATEATIEPEPEPAEATAVVEAAEAEPTEADAVAPEPISAGDRPVPTFDQWVSAARFSRTEEPEAPAAAAAAPGAAVESQATPDVEPEATPEVEPEKAPDVEKETEPDAETATEPETAPDVEPVTPEVEPVAPEPRSIWAPPGEASSPPPTRTSVRSIWEPQADAEPSTAVGASVDGLEERPTAVLPVMPDDVADVRTPPAPLAGPTTPSFPDTPAAPAAVDLVGRAVPPVPAPSFDTTAPATTDRDRPSRRRRWVVVGVVAAVLVVLGGLYVGALWLWSDRVPPGTTVAGVDIGGRQAADAVAALNDGLAAAATQELTVAVGESTATLVPGDAGLTFDAQATVDSVTGFGLEPTRLWHQLFGGPAVTPISEVDRDALGAALESVSDQLSTPYVDGTVAFVDGQIAVTSPTDGVALDVPAATDLLAADWLTRARPVELPTVADPAVIGQAQLDQAVTALARPLSEGPVTVAVGGQKAELPVEVLMAAASFVPKDDALVLQMDGAALVDAVLARTTDLLTPASDATFSFDTGAPTVVPGTPGTTIDPAALATAVTSAATAKDPADRTTEVQLVETDPQQSTEALQALGIVEVVSEFSTPLTSEPRRTQNITNGASKVNGTLVLPGETFSLGDTLGPMDAEHGYVQAGAIVSGEHTDAWGGGLSQMSTTTYNAAFFAGFELLEHTAHSEWFQRYPEGRESTIFTPKIDLKWRNNTPYGALLQSWVEGGRVYVRVWSTKYFTVETSTSGRSNVRQPTTTYSQSPTCEAQRAGNPGFTVTVTRRVLLNGAEQSNEHWTTTYKPQNAIVCGAPPA